MAKDASAFVLSITFLPFATVSIVCAIGKTERRKQLTAERVASDCVEFD